ncbi:MAG: NUDIX hydrolase [Puniceicoccaceae bacterium]|nr:NUDIX hydrolase [Puniceicoccaceae bacterium]RCL30467.1 MAG: NUDIX domain-containing protein [Puniceicoccaceae bacterium]|tara:strand:+ start:1630 stop:2178 length:549 start_codon:yes stop_codon:yes gene_type:complete
MNNFDYPLNSKASNTVEYFDVVDAYDRVVGVAPRQYIHSNKLFHRAVHVFVYNHKNDIFLQKRSLNKDSAPGKWVSSCSGHVDSGEYYFDAARRELAEEIGLNNPIDLKLAKIQCARPETGYEHVHLFVCHAEGPFRLNPIEISEGLWIAPEKLDLWVEEEPRDFAWSFTYLWQCYRSQLDE